MMFHFGTSFALLVPAKKTGKVGFVDYNYRVQSRFPREMRDFG